MAMKKEKKHPRKPSAKANVATMEKYIKRCKEIDKENVKIRAENKKKEALKLKIKNM